MIKAVLPYAYTGYAGCAITMVIPVNFGTAHGKSWPEVGSPNALTSMGEKGLSRPPKISALLSQK